jgi:hypothetical protein
MGQVVAKDGVTGLGIEFLEQVRKFAYSQEVYVRVQWNLFTFPIFLLILCLVFLMATTMEPSDGAKGIWKTSVIPTLVYGLSKEAQTHLGSSMYGNQAGLFARKLRVKSLLKTGWRIMGMSFRQ